MRKYILIIAALVLAISQDATAQRSRQRATANDRTAAAAAGTEAIAEAYLDSLRGYRLLVDSLMAANDSLREAHGHAADNRYYHYFAPLAYYPDVAGRRLRLYASEPTEEENTLMGIYLNRPDLPRYTADKIGKAAESDAKGAQQQPERLELVKEVKAPAPVMQQEVKTEIPQGGMELYVAKPSFWKFSGDYFLQFMQNHVSENWYKSGSKNYSMLGSVTLQYNYNNKQKIKWDNKLEMKLGFITSEADTVNKFKASEDLLRYTSKLGVQAHKNWYYTMQLIATTQFTRGYKDNKDKVFSDFLSPFNLNVSLGMDYSLNVRDRLKGTAHVAPLAYNLKYCDRYNLTKSFGIKDDRYALNDFGSQFTVEMTWTPWDVLKWQMRLYGFTTYHKFELECENTVTFRFNKYISTNLFLYPRFDDGVKRMEGHDFWQFKEYLSVGFSYSM